MDIEKGTSVAVKTVCWSTKSGYLGIKTDRGTVVSADDDYIIEIDSGMDIGKKLQYPKNEVNVAAYDKECVIENTGIYKDEQAIAADDIEFVLEFEEIIEDDSMDEDPVDLDQIKFLME